MSVRIRRPRTLIPLTYHIQIGNTRVTNADGEGLTPTRKEKTEASQENDKFPLYFLLKDQPSPREGSKRPEDKSLLWGLQWVKAPLLYDLRYHIVSCR